MKQGNKMMLVLLSLLSLSACRPYAMNRTDAWRALPLSAKKFMKRPCNYVSLTLKVNPVLMEGETGTAWNLLVRRSSGKIQKHFAILFRDTSQEKNHSFQAIIPESIHSLRRAKFILISHDSMFCYNTEGREFFCPSPAKFKWKKHGVPFVHGKRGVQAVRKGGEHDRELLSFYRQALKNVMIKRFGTSLSMARYKQLKNRSGLLWRFIAELTGFGLVLGEVLLISKSWHTALLSAGIFTVIRVLGMLVTPKALRGPEYFSSAASNRSLAIKVVKLRLERAQMRRRMELRIRGLEERLRKLESSRKEAISQ